MSCLVLASRYMPACKVDLLADKIYRACDVFAKAPLIETLEESSLKQDCQRVVKSAYLRKEYRTLQLNETGYYIRPKMMDFLVPEMVENETIMRKVGCYSMVSFKAVCELALKNKSLRDKLKLEKSTFKYLQSIPQHS